MLVRVGQANAAAKNDLQTLLNAQQDRAARDE